MERRLATFAVVALYLAAAPQPFRSPDGLEMMALALDWAGNGPPVDGSFWPPLWPALLTPLAALGELERSAWVLNLMLAGAIAWPLQLMCERLSGPWAARAAVFFWALVPVIWMNGAVLDARPLGWFLCAMAAALAIDAHHGGRPWWHAFVFAAIAPLARPEGLSLVPLIAVSALLLGHAWKSIVPFALGALCPTLVDGALREGGRGTWGAFWVPWSESWEMVDFLALYGIASAPTGFRDFVVQQLDAGVETPPSALGLLLGPPDVAFVALGLVQCVGIAMLVAAAVGAGVLVLRSKSPLRSAAVVALSCGPLVALSFTPMLRGQAEPHTNLAFLTPVLVALAFSGSAEIARLLRRRQLLSAIPVSLALVALLEVHYGPFIAAEPEFIEDSPEADAMAAWLQVHPPESGRVACTIAGRGVVRSAGLEPLTLASTWEEWSPGERDGVLVNSVDFALGEDGGRGLEVLEDPDWQTAQVIGDADFFFVYLERR